MEDRETPRMCKYGESKTTRIMMAAVPHVTSGSGLRKFQADGYLFDRVHIHQPLDFKGLHYIRFRGFTYSQVFGNPKDLKKLYRFNVAFFCSPVPFYRINKYVNMG